jgi:hypothetical protein
MPVDLWWMILSAGGSNARLLHISQQLFPSFTKEYIFGFFLWRPKCYHYRTSVCYFLYNLIRSFIYIDRHILWQLSTDYTEIERTCYVGVYHLVQVKYFVPLVRKWTHVVLVANHYVSKDTHPGKKPTFLSSLWHYSVEYCVLLSGVCPG